MNSSSYKGAVLFAAALSITGAGGRNPVAAAPAAPADGTPPTVAITRPPNGVTLTRRWVTVWVKATDASGVAKVELYVDGKRSAERTAAPWRFAWDVKKAGEGPHLLVARAYDRAGNKADSAGILVYPH
jgi:hypothetical protein